MADEREAYTIEAFCRAFSTSRSQTYRELAAGRLRAVKLGSRTLILRADADAWAAALRAFPAQVEG
ncbi:DNA-binding protein [Devosia sp.]|uniref:DNA-binding protein n=1 Tax=Devosia sp. TaxID=1871048 RepID=UPI0035B46140